MKHRSYVALSALVVLSILPMQAAAQDDSVLIPSQLELSDEQRADLQKLIEKSMTTLVKQCVGQYPRPEFFSELTVQFELKKSGALRGNYLPGVADSSMYVKSDEEKAKLEEAGSLARLTVGNDRDLERCFQKGTREISTDLDRYAATVAVIFEVSWKGSTPALKSKDFQVTKN